MTGVVVSEQQKPTPQLAPRRGRSEMHRRQRTKNIAVFLALVAMVALFYVLTIVRMGGSILK